MNEETEPLQSGPWLADEPDSEPEPIDGAEPIALIYTGRTRDIARIALLNLVLSLLTLGIYNFWGRTRIRRYLWAHTRVNDSPLEYHGTGGQIFLGFILISVLFFAFNVGYEYTQQLYLERVLGTENLLLFSVPPVLLFTVGYMAFLAYVGWSSRRYWLAMTSWRGIRFRQGGSRRKLLWRALPWSALTALSLGFAYPWLASMTENYVYRESHIGTTRANSAITGGRLFGSWLPMAVTMTVLLWGPVLGIIIAVDVGLRDEVTWLLSKVGPYLSETVRKLGEHYIAPALFVVMLPLICIWSFWRARLFNRVVSAVTLGDLSLRACLSWQSVAGAYAATAFMCLALFQIAVWTEFFFLWSWLQTQSGSLGTTFPIILFGVTMVLVWSYFRNIFVVHGLWRARVRATDIHGTIDATIIRQGEIRKSQQGEGFGMAFEGGFGEA